MSNINWTKYHKRIPSSVKIGKTTYRIFWVDGYPNDPYQLGETNFEGEKFISININQSVKEIVHTYFHELCHAISNEWSINLSEKQVMLMEKSLTSWLKPCNIFTKEEMNGKIQRNKSYKRKRGNSSRIRKTCSKTR